MKTLSRRILMPLLERIENGNTFERRKELERTQWLLRDELNQLRQRRLQSLITYAYENIPFYHRIFPESALTLADIKTVEDLNKLPILTKQDIRENFEQLTAQNHARRRMLVMSNVAKGCPL